MDHAFINRIGSLTDDDDETAPAVARSPAQREAARRNGAFSRGPITVEGKAKSRLNALRHGLLARVLVPPADTRGQDRLYLQIRRELTEELRPSTFTQRTAVDALAHDYLQLARASAMMEALQRPARPNDDLAKTWDTVAEVKRKLASLKRVANALANDGLSDCTSRDARLVAEEVVSFVAAVKEDVSPPDDDIAFTMVNSPTDLGSAGIPAADVRATPNDRPVTDYFAGLNIDEFEKKEADECEALWAAVRPPRESAAAPERIADVLRGRVKVGKAELAWLRRTVGRSAAALGKWLKNQDAVVRQMQDREASSLRKLAEAPDGLILLQRYERAIQRSIDNRLKRFPRAS